MADKTTIRVPRETRDHLAQVAKERGVTLGQLVEQLASAQLTAAQIAEHVAATRKMLGERMGCTLTDKEFDEGLHTSVDIDSRGCSASTDVSPVPSPDPLTPADRDAHHVPQ
ncbi:hypothetical protein ABZY20_14980 [Streptomyces sp. NPDC006624]|uniref:hypothetical protein n=1 Tax=Streptomyces sp. NPDC006624 TaxID=3154892 RepID=UPI0033A8877A